MIVPERRPWVTLPPRLRPSILLHQHPTAGAHNVARAVGETHAELPVASLLLGAGVLGIAPNPTVSGCPSASGRRDWPQRVPGREVRAEVVRSPG